LLRVFSKSQTDSGMVPPMLVSWRVNADSFVESPRDSGIVPLKKLLCNCKNSSSGKTPMPETSPVMRLSLRSSCVSVLRLSSSDVKLPVSWLKSKSIKINGKLAISVGIVPVRPPLIVQESEKNGLRVRRAFLSAHHFPSLQQTYRSMPQTAKSVKSAISVGIVPTKLFSSNSISVTQPLMQEIPAHWHSFPSLKNWVSPSKGN